MITTHEWIGSKNELEDTKDNGYGNDTDSLPQHNGYKPKIMQMSRIKHLCFAQVIGLSIYTTCSTLSRLDTLVNRRNSIRQILISLAWD